MAVTEEWVWVMTCPTKLQMDPEVAKEQALRVNAKKATKMQTEPELECTAPCIRCLYSSLMAKQRNGTEPPMWLLELYWASPHSCTALTDSMKLPAVPSNVAKDSYGLLTKSASKVDKAPVSADVARQTSKAAKKARQKAARYETKKQLLAQKSSAEADSPLRRQNMVPHSKEPTPNWSWASTKSSSATEASSEFSSPAERAPQSSQIAGATIKAGPQPGPKSGPQPGPHLTSAAEADLKSSEAEATPKPSTAEASLKTSTAEAAPKSSTAEASPQSSTAEAAIKTSEEEAFKISEETALKTSEEATIKTETMCSSKKLAVNESLCISSQVCKTFNDDPSQTEVTMANTDVTSSQPEITMANTDVTPSQTEITEDNTDENPSQPEIAKVHMSATSNRTKQASKYKEQQSSSCKSPGCGEPAKLQCPTCIKLNIQGSFFCSQDCFKGNWDLHKALHKLARNHTCINSEAHSLMAHTEKDNGPVKQGKLNTATTAGGVYWNKLRKDWQYDLPPPPPEPVRMSSRPSLFKSAKKTSL